MRVQVAFPRPEPGGLGFKRYSVGYFTTLCRSVCVPLIAGLVQHLWLQLPLYAQLLGQASGLSIGRNVYLDTSRTGDPGMITIGDQAILDRGATLLSHAQRYTKEHGQRITFASILIGPDVRVGPRAALAQDSHVNGGESIASGSFHWQPASEITQTEGDAETGASTLRCVNIHLEDQS